MTEWQATLVVGLIAIVGHLTSGYLFWRLRAGQLEIKSAILHEADTRYANREVCLTRMTEDERRIDRLEARRA